MKALLSNTISFLAVCACTCFVSIFISFSVHAHGGAHEHSENEGHPRLLLSSANTKSLKYGLENYPLFTKSVNISKQFVDDALNKPVVVPQPKDAGGGYTHEQHKRNFKLIRQSGLLYQITGNASYAEYVKKILLAYAQMYPGLGEHPAKKEQSPGRLFWQSLNEAMWLVNSIQGYDAVAQTFSEDERQLIESNLFMPMASFLSDESPQTFDKIHNHGTWANAAVGMTGYALDNKELVEKALLGLKRDGKAGFIQHLKSLFSPDGYYNEGPYYQRFALMPFILFAAAIEKNEPERKIFEYRDGILLKAVYATIQMSYNGLFFPINDAIKDKGLTTVELKHAIAIVYDLKPDPGLLSIATHQGVVDLASGGVKLARDIYYGKKIELFPFQTMSLSDGAEGKDGALHVLRSGSAAGHQAVVVKNTSQGQGHGHFDKLNWMFYDNGHEIVTDYGAARFLNVEAKYGGHYLPENNLWAKQTVAHNTLVVDETSHFNGELKVAEKYAPEVLYFVDDKVSDSTTVSVSAAKIEKAYDDTSFSRYMAMLTIPEFEYPLVVDILRAESEKKHNYDLPLYYRGHIVETNFELKGHGESLKPLGKSSGYEYLWLRGEAKPEDLAQVTWLLDNRFYSYSSVSNQERRMSFVEVGANDPDFSLRHEQGLMIRSEKAKQMTFASILEPHGEYNPAAEYTLNSHSAIKSLHLHEGTTADVIAFEDVSGRKWHLGLSRTGDVNARHRVTVDKTKIEWKGLYYFKRI